MATSIKSPATGVDDGGGAAAWTNPDRIVSSNDSYASITATGTPSNKLRGSAFGFAIPSAATIVGVRVRIEKRRTSGTWQDITVQLRNELGLYVGQNKASASNWDTGDTYAAYGSASDLWGLTLTPAIINDTDFGVCLASQGDGGAGNVDHFEITVYYNTPPNIPTNLTPLGTVNTLVPNFSGNLSDPDAGDQLSGVEIEVRRVSDDALMWSSGVLAASGGSFSKPYNGTTLAPNIQYKWRTRTRDNGSPQLWGVWTSFINFTPSPTTAPLVIGTEPPAFEELGTTNPTFEGKFIGRFEGATFEAVQIQVRRVSDQVSFWDTGESPTTAAEESAETFTRPYLGTVLATGVNYEWRVRGKDNVNNWSDWWGWNTFSIINKPDVPTNITPSGVVNTLTPTISGTYNAGVGGTEIGYQYRIIQGVTTIYDSGEITATVLGTGQAYGTNNPNDSPATPPALAWGTAYTIQVRTKGNSTSSWSNWTDAQAFSTNAAPTTPTNLSPVGAIISDTTPTLTWKHNDPEVDAQTSVEIELRKVSDSSVVTGYGPKTLSQSAQSHDVTETLINSPNTAYKFRVRTQGLAGPGYSPWSSFVEFTVGQVPDVAVTAPTLDQVLTQPLFTASWTYTGGSGPQSTYRVIVYGSDQVTIVYDSTELSGTATNHVVPAGYLENSKTYYIQVRAEDSASAEGISSSIRFSTAWTPPGTITGLTIIAQGAQL